MSNPPVLHFNALSDPHNPDNVVRPNSDGSINVDIIGGSVTVAAPIFTPVAGAQFGLALDAITPVSLTVPATARYAQIAVSSANIRYRDDGGNPSSIVGMPVYQASSWLYGGDLTAIKFITQAGNGTLDVLYYK